MGKGAFRAETAVEGGRGNERINDSHSSSQRHMKHFFVLSSFKPEETPPMLNSYPPDLPTEATTLALTFPESPPCFQHQITLHSGAISTLRALSHSFYSCS